MNNALIDKSDDMMENLSEPNSILLIVIIRKRVRIYQKCY